jgi:hypothetical protein
LGVVLIDFAKLTAGQIAVLTAGATLVAAILGGTFALVVALVNTYSARRIARDNSRRDFRLKLLDPLVIALDREVTTCREVVALLAAAKVTSPDDVSYQLERFKRTNRLEYPIGVYSVFQSHRPLAKSIEEYASAVSNLDTVSRQIQKFLLESGDNSDEYMKKTNWLTLDGADSQFSQLKTATNDCIGTAIQVRSAMERFVFG